MHADNKVYRELQKHFDRQAVAFPATRSGAEIRILKRIFKPDEARLALHLSYKPRSVQQIYETAKESGISFSDMDNMLDRMMKNGGIKLIERAGARYYCTLPFVVGMYENQGHKLSPEFISDAEKYKSDITVGLAFLDTVMPQMRTIPVEKSIPFDCNVTTYDHLTNVINETNGPFVVFNCMCRKVAVMKGNPCQKTSRLETCMCLGDWAKNAIIAGAGREISKEEALEITRRNEADGLVLQPSNTQKVEFVCACCGCCCGILRVHKMLHNPVAFWASNYYASVNNDICNDCEVCIERCQVNAISIDERLSVASVDLKRCIGCGNCVASCTADAISLLRKEKETIPPVDTESLHDTIMANRKGKLGKAALAMRVIMKK